MANSVLLRVFRLDSANTISCVHIIVHSQMVYSGIL